MGGMVEIRNREEFEAWLEDRPRSWSRVLALRAALRVLPFLSALSPRDLVVLPVFRAALLSWVAARYRVPTYQRRFADTFDFAIEALSDAVAILRNPYKSASEEVAVAVRAALRSEFLRLSS
jgi:hypothetical protein